MKTPTVSYRVCESACEFTPLRGRGDLVGKDGRFGLHFESIHGRARIPSHTLAEPRGTVVAWVLPMQEMFPVAPYPAHARSNPFFNRFVVLSDREVIGDIEAAGFSWLFSTDWHPVFLAKFGPGSIECAIGNVAGPSRVAFAASGHFEMPRQVWQQIAVTWDHEAGDYALWCNGVKVGAHDTSQEKGVVFPAGASLFLGNPGVAIGTTEFYSGALSGEELAAKFQAEAVVVSEPWQSRLQRIYQGENLAPMPELPTDRTDGWVDQGEFRLDAGDLYSDFFVQGAIHCYRQTDEGLRLTTDSFEKKAELDAFVKPLSGPELDLTRTYLFTRRTFEGDLCVSVDFKIHAHGGLALLMAGVAGMQGEDFLQDYPGRTDGSMRCVCWEDLRNYHWEFYREMKDVRNDLVSHAVLKNPWFKPVAFQIEPRTWELERWYRLSWLHVGDRVLGAIDGNVVVDFTDTGFDNNGPVLRNGRVALRAMMRTDMTFRNLRILARPDVTRRPASC